MSFEQDFAGEYESGYEYEDIEISGGEYEEIGFDFGKAMRNMFGRLKRPTVRLPPPKKAAARPLPIKHPPVRSTVALRPVAQPIVLPQEQPYEEPYEEQDQEQPEAPYEETYDEASEYTSGDIVDSEDYQDVAIGFDFRWPKIKVKIPKEAMKLAMIVGPAVATVFPAAAPAIGAGLIILKALDSGDPQHIAQLVATKKAAAQGDPDAKNTLDTLRAAMAVRDAVRAA